MISRFSPAVWIVPLSHDPAVCQGLVFSCGIHSIQFDGDPDNWRSFARDRLREHAVPGPVAMLAVGPSSRNADAHHRREFFRIEETPVYLALQRN
jgi:pyruvate kinase